MVPGTPPYLSIFFCASLYVLGFTPSYSRIQTKYRRNTPISYVSLFFHVFMVVFHILFLWYFSGVAYFSVPFVRTIMDRYQLQEMTKRDEEGKLNAIFDSLNFLGTTCWKINTKILDIMISLFNDKGDKMLEIIGPDLPPLPKIKVT